jgi:hypothetical protein
VERNKLTLRDLPTSPGDGAEVSRSHSKPATSRLCCPKEKTEVSHKDEGLNVRRVKPSVGLWQGDNNRNTLENYLRGG